MDLGCGGGIVPGGAQEAQERAPQNAQEARGRAEAGGAGAGKTLLPLLAPVSRAGGGGTAASVTGVVSWGLCLRKSHLAAFCFTETEGEDAARASQSNVDGI